MRVGVGPRRQGRPGCHKAGGFRCSGASFDESHYARSLAKELATEHHEVKFGEQESASVVQAIAQMEVPFCDVGIEVGTWIPTAPQRGKPGSTPFGRNGLKLRRHVCSAALAGTTLFVILSEERHPLRGRLFAALSAFMAAMLGVVLADNVVTLFVFWELTSLTSYILIGFEQERPAG